ncbi:MAG: TonB-dependent receptor [Bacteroidota bacterium]
MKKSATLFLFLVIPFFKIFCQSNAENTFSIQGKIEDKSNKAIADELVYLFSKQDSLLVKTEFSDANGNFIFQNIKENSYFIRIKNSLFEQFSSQEFALNQTLTLDKFVLTEKQTNLNEVTVAIKKPVIERKAGKMIVNVEQSLQAASSSAFEIIEKSPGVAISITDAISINGKQGVVVQINGKSLQMSGSDLANYLRGIPSSNIEKIEFILNPSSKYDASGSILIDIRMKKDTRFGTNGTFTSSYGQGVYPKINNALNLNHRTKKWNFFASYSFAYRKAFNSLKLERKFYENDTFKLAYYQNNYITFPFKNHILRTGFDYQIDSIRTLSFSFSGVSNKFQPNGSNVSDVYNQNFDVISRFETINKSDDNWYSASSNLNYKKIKDTLGSTFSVDFDYALYGNKTIQNFTTNYYDASGILLQNPYNLHGDLQGKLNIYSLKADWNKAFKNSSSLEYGAKSSYVNANNDIQFFDRSNNLNTYDSSKSNHFIYTENINAVYTNYNFTHKKWTYQLGLRLENTNITGNQLVYNQKFDTSYTQLFPSISLRFAANEKHSFDFNLNRRIDRASYDQLNPFKFYLDPTTYKEGNPYLRPQTSIGFDLGHLFKDKFYTSLGFARTLDNITEIIAPSAQTQNITIQTNINLEHVDLAYTNISLPFELKKWWTLRADFNAYLALYSGNAANTRISKNGSYNANVNINSQFMLTKKQTLELSGSYRTREVYAFDSIKQIWSVNLAYQTKILKDKGSLKINFTDIFFTNGITADVTFTDYREKFVVKRETRVISFAFTYRFGNSQLATRRRAGGAEDLKQRVGGQGNG